MESCEVLRYLGFKNKPADESTLKLIDECKSEIKELTNGRYVYKSYDIDLKDKKVILKNAGLEIESNSLYKLLKDCRSCFIIAATLGNAVDARIRYYEAADLTRAVVFDACASTAIEDVCDNAEEEIKRIINNKYLTMRYSPGYGDLSIALQKKFISLISADKTIGLTVSQSNVLFPLKSVTAICGVTDKNAGNDRKNCVNCSKFNDCRFRRSSSYGC